MKHREVIVLLVSLVWTSLASGADNNTIQREAAFNSLSSTDEYRYAVMRASIVASIYDEWKQNPRQFDRVIPHRDLGVQRFPRNESQILRFADRHAKEKLHGYDPSAEPYHQIVSDVLSILPFELDAVYRITAKTLSTRGEGIQQYDPVWYKDAARGLLSRVDQGDRLGDTINSIFVDEANFNAKNKNWSEHLGVKFSSDRLARIEENDAEQKRLQQEINDDFRQILELEKARKEEADRRANEDEQYRYRQADLVGSIEAAGYLFQLVGAPNEARKAFDVARIANTLLDLNRPGANLPPGAYLAGYMGAASVAISLFSSQSDPDQALAEAILDAIFTLREEMHERLDTVDVRLSRLLALSERNFADLNNAIRELHLKNDALGEAIKDRTQSIESALEAQAQISELSFLDFCINYRKAISPSLSTNQVEACIAYFDKYANEFSMHSLVAARSLATVDVELSKIPYAKSVQKIADRVIEAGGRDLKTALAPSDELVERTKIIVAKDIFLPNPEVWLRYSNDFVKFLRDDPTRESLVTSAGYKNFITAGESIQRFFQRLTFDSDGAFRFGVFDAVLNAYSAQALRLLHEAKVAAVGVPNPGTPAEPVQPKMNLISYEQQLADYVPLYFHRQHYGIKQNLEWCQGVAPRTIRYRYGLATVSEDPTATRLTIAQLTRAMIKTDVKLYEWLGIGRIRFCLEKLELSDFSGTTPTSRIQTLHYDAAVKVQFEVGAGNGEILDVSRMAVKSDVEVRHAHQGRQPLLEMVWSGSHHRPNQSELADDQRLPIIEALTRPKLVTITDLFSVDAYRYVHEQAEAKLDALRYRAMQKFIMESSVRQEVQAQLFELRTLIDALYVLGLRPYLDKEERVRFSEVLDNQVGIIGWKALARLAFYGNSAGETSISLSNGLDANAHAPSLPGAIDLEASVDAVRQLLMRYVDKEMVPTGNPWIESQLVQLRLMVH